MKTNSGVTLPELLIALIIIAIVMAIGVPTWSMLVRRTRAASQTNQLVRAVNFARMAAIKHREVVTICKSRDQSTCSGEWSDGQIVFIDINSNGKLDGSDKLLFTFPATPAGGTLTWRGFPTSEYLQLLPTGFTNNQNGTFIYSPVDKDPKYVRKVVVSQTGRVRVSIAHPMN